MTHISRRAFCWMSVEALALLAAGCRVVDFDDAAVTKSGGEGELLAPLAADDQVALEVFFVHVPLADAATMEAVWRDVDEQHFAVDLRRRLAEHGFRVGMASGDVPQTIQKLLHVNGSTSAADESDSTDTGEAQPLASRQELRLRPSGKGEIVPCPPRDSMTLITVDKRELSGRTLRAAQGRFIVRCQTLDDGRVRVSLAPQLQHGDVKRRFLGGDGAFRPDISQDKIEFESLSIAADLAAGEMIVLGTLAEPLLSLARDFLTDASSGKPVQKVVVVRRLAGG